MRAILGVSEMNLSKLIFNAGKDECFSYFAKLLVLFSQTRNHLYFDLLLIFFMFDIFDFLLGLFG